MMQLAFLLALLTAAPPQGSALLEFSAEWCGPCRAMKPVVQELERRGIPIHSIDIDQDKTTASHFNVRAVPTFVVVGPDGKELARRVGGATADELARWFREAGASAPKQPDEKKTAPRGPPNPDLADATDKTGVRNPSPWATTVRLRIRGPNASWNGSGTVIGSSATESFILTCGHLFQGASQEERDRRAHRVEVDLFDGVPITKHQGERAETTTLVKTVVGAAIDIDFELDLAIVRIEPGETLPFSRVVPPSWEPKELMSMRVFGCYESQTPSMFKTAIVQPLYQGQLIGKPGYQAIECRRRPAQGRSGGGLFTDDHYICGVTNFMEQGDGGLYAHPKSIYRILDRNKLSRLYERRTGAIPPDSQASAAVATSPILDAEAGTLDRDSAIEAACKRWFQRHPGPQGPAGPAGPPGPAGPSGGSEPVDLSAILARLVALEQEAAKPITVAIKTPGGQVFKQDFSLKPNASGQTGIGNGFPPRSIGIDLSKFAVPIPATAK